MKPHRFTLWSLLRDRSFTTNSAAEADFFMSTGSYWVRDHHRIRYVA